jgi:hypothetical protein
MVEANGKPYQNQNNRVYNIAEQPVAASAAQPASKASYEDAFIGLVANLSLYHHLNW